MMTEQERELLELKPYMDALGPLQGCHFAGAVSQDGWLELARTLKECSKSANHAARIVRTFVRTPRFDDKGQLLTSVPATIELRIFARSVPATEVPEGELPPLGKCPDCDPYDGLWRIVSRNGVEGTDRCLCPRGEALRARDAARVPVVPPDAEAEKRGGSLGRISETDWAKRAAGDTE